MLIYVLFLRSFQSGCCFFPGKSLFFLHFWGKNECVCVKKLFFLVRNRKKKTYFSNECVCPSKLCQEKKKEKKKQWLKEKKTPTENCFLLGLNCRGRSSSNSQWCFQKSFQNPYKTAFLVKKFSPAAHIQGGRGVVWHAISEYIPNHSQSGG